MLTMYSFVTYGQKIHSKTTFNDALYLYSIGEKENDESKLMLASIVFLEYAQKGSTEAMAALGTYYMHTKEYTEAFEWLKKGAQKGNADAQFKLGCLYSVGKGVDKNDELALKWIKKSAQNNHKNAQKVLKEYYESNPKDEKKVLKSKSKNDNKTALYKGFIEKSKRGDAKYQLIVSMMYYLGEGVPKNDKLSFEWLKKSAENNNKEAQKKLAQMYYQGVGTPKDEEEAFYWLERSKTK